MLILSKFPVFLAKTCAFVTISRQCVKVLHPFLTQIFTLFFNDFLHCLFARSTDCQTFIDACFHRDRIINILLPLQTGSLSLIPLIRNPSKYNRSLQYQQPEQGTPPHYVSESATIKNSNISDGCIVEGEVENSILFPGVKIEKGAKVDYSIIMPNTVVKANADIKYSIVSENTVIGCNAVIGGNPEDTEDKDKWGIAVIGDDLHIGDNVVVPPAAMIGEDLEAE